MSETLFPRGRLSQGGPASPESPIVQRAADEGGSKWRPRPSQHREKPIKGSGREKALEARGRYALTKKKR